MATAPEIPIPQQQAAPIVVVAREKAVADRLAVLSDHPYGVGREEFVTITSVVWKFGHNVVAGVEGAGRYNVGRIIAFLDALQGIKYAMLDMVKPFLRVEAESSPLADPFICNMLDMIGECNFCPGSDLMTLVSVATLRLAKELTRLAGTLVGYNRDRLISILVDLQATKGLVADAVNINLLPPTTKVPGS